jgi:uncharacterized membrane protein YdbT with pleckstrin-like domain
MKENGKTQERKFRPPWRSFYWHIIAIVAVLVLFIAAVNRGWVGRGVVSIAFLLVLVLVILDVLRRRFRIMLIVKNDEVALENGFIGRHSVEISSMDINTIEVRQSIMQRVLNVGDIRIASAGTSGYEITAPGLAAPYDIRNEIQAIERAAKNFGSGDD